MTKTSTSLRRFSALLHILSALTLLYSPAQCIGFTNPTAKAVMDKREQKLVDDKNRPPKFDRPITTTALSAKGRRSNAEEDEEEDINSDSIMKKKKKRSVELGSKEYYDGFVSRDIREEPLDRISGDAILDPTLKFVGSFSVLIVALLLIFLWSNGLI